MKFMAASWLIWLGWIFSVAAEEVSCNFKCKLKCEWASH